MRRFLLLCCLLETGAWALALELSAPPPLTTRGGGVVFLLFSLNNPEGVESAVLEPRFPEGFQLLSPVERQLSSGVNLFPLSVDIAGNVPAGDYELCLRIRDSFAEACAGLTVVPREALEFHVPREVFGDTLRLELTNGGNLTETLELRGEGEVGIEPRTVTLAPGETQSLELELGGTGSLRLYINERLYLVQVKRLDGAPPVKTLELRAATSYDPLEHRLESTLTLEGSLSDYAAIEGQLFPEPFARLAWSPAVVAVGWLPAPYSGVGVRARYGEPWGAELGLSRTDGRTLAGTGLVYSGAGSGYLRLLYDGDIRASGGVNDLSLGGWRAEAAFDDSELSADLVHDGRKLGFGVRYAYAGDLLLQSSFGSGEARGRLSYEQGESSKVRLSLSSGPVAWTAAAVFDESFRVDWRVGFQDELGPGRFSLQVGAQDNSLLFGSSYALPIPGVPGLSAAAALQYAGEWRYGGALSYQIAPWSLALSLNASEAGLQLAYTDGDAALSLDAALGDEPRLSVSGHYSLSWAAPEAVVQAFGGRRWARLEGRVRLRDGRGLEGMLIDAGERRVKSGPGGRYMLWLPPGAHTLRLLPDGLPLETIPPAPKRVRLDEAARLELDFVLRPAGAVQLVCSGAELTAATGLNLFGASGSSLVGCGRTVGGLPAGRYRLEPFGLDPALIASHPATVDIATGETQLLRLELSPRPPPEITRPELTLQPPALLTAAPGEELLVKVESNASLIYAVMPSGDQHPLDKTGSDSFQLSIQIPFAYTEPLYRLEFTAVAGGDRLERQTLIRIDPRRPLFETRLAPAHGEVGDTVTVTVTTRFTSRSVKLLGPELEIVLEATQPYTYEADFQVPDAWRGREDVTLKLVLNGAKRLEESYLFRLND